MSNAESGPAKISLAIYPFNDVQKSSLDMSIPALLQSEFSRFEFLQIVPVEVVREKLYEIEPVHLWTEKDGNRKRGGILWNIEPLLFEKINSAVNARFYIYGDLLYFGDSWRIDAFLKEKGEAEPEKSFNLSGENDGEIPVRLSELAKSISVWLRKENVLNEAEADVRKYMAGLTSYSAAIMKMKNHISMAPESIPVRALLLDLYLMNKDVYQGEILEEGRRIIELAEGARQEDMRYLLSINIDPFDTVAAVYEKQGNLEGAIMVRANALKRFPYNSGLHRMKSGENHYLLARAHEAKGQKSKAAENYGRAIDYLKADSEYFQPAMEGLDRLKQ